MRRSTFLVVAVVACITAACGSRTGLFIGAAGGALDSGAPIDTENVPSCDTNPYSTTPTSLGTLSEGYPQPRSLALAGTSVFVGVQGPMTDPTGANILERTPDGSFRAVVPNDFLSGVLFANAERLVFSKVIVTSMGGGSFVFTYPNIAVLDRVDGTIRTLANAKGETVDASSLALMKKGDVYWIARSDRKTWLLHWDGVSESSTVVHEDENLQSLHTDGERAYYRSIARDAVTFFSAEAGRGPIAFWTTSQGTPTVEAVDDAYVYLLGSGGVLSRIPKTGGVPKVILTDPAFERMTQIATDKTHVYWSAADAIKRVPKEGGPIETMASASNRWIAALVVDACNIYWSRQNPGELMVRAK